MWRKTLNLSQPTDQFLPFLFKAPLKMCTYWGAGLAEAFRTSFYQQDKKVVVDRIHKRLPSFWQGKSVSLPSPYEHQHLTPPYKYKPASPPHIIPTTITRHAVYRLKGLAPIFTNV
ncbi:hypothetical protein BaRGS_00010205 [Batillaria attramentaria]|uniref:Uncharacterized protein n=1 Tax=Batillaria attramentaria TaxID=370345 RepID=A0ABD0LGI1_9CAEN